MRYIVTGASSGIGKRCAERLLSSGNECVLVARSEDKLKKIKEKYPQTYIVVSDLLKPGTIEKIFSELKVLFPFDGLVHCAGIAPLKRTDENDINTVRDTYATNVFSFLEMMRFFVQDGACRDGGSVVAMSSVVAHRGSNRQSIYSGTKAALEATVRCMAKELIYRKIRVNTVVSGTVETEMLCKLRCESPNLNVKIEQHSPLGIVPVEEVCEIIEFLLSDNASHITGVSMPIDSGYLL
jgi:NAD(P)-dependent dehydrogenase (short-subunit alcohol dehydrogenase family)